MVALGYQGDYILVGFKPVNCIVDDRVDVIVGLVFRAQGFGRFPLIKLALHNVECVANKEDWDSFLFSFFQVALEQVTVALSGVPMQIGQKHHLASIVWSDAVEFQLIGVRIGLPY